MSLLHKSCSSSLQAAARVPGSRKPFTPAFNGSKRVQQQLVTRAAEQDDAMLQAEAEAAAQDAAIAVEEFDFNYSDAKKGNQWQPSDVEAALEYYQSEGFLQGSSSMPYEQEFVTNPLSAYPGGPEDSSWLADVDNNEAYENDDYALAGIPEAAPKVKRNQREEEEAENEEELRAAEDEKIAAAAFDDVEGLDDEADDNPDAAWNWRLDDGPVYEEEEASSGAALSGDVSLLNSLANVDLTQHDELTLEQKDMLSVVLSQVDGSGIDDGLDLIGMELPEASDDIVTLSEEETASIEAVLAEADAAEAEAAAVLAEVPSFDLSRELAEAAAYTATGAPVPAAEYQQYLAALKAWDASQVAPVEQATVQQLLAEGEAVEMGAVPEVGEAPELPDVTAALTAEDPVFEKFLATAEASPDEEAARELMDMVGELQTISADVDEYNEMVFPADEDLQEYERFIDAALDYYAATGGDAGPELAERPEDAPVNMFDDINPELLGADALGAGGDDYESYERGQFVERILELGRVTKVVKGGKIMGFRCVAVVGDGKGRVGVGCQAGREVGTAVKRALVDAKKSIITVPLIGAGTIPHRSEAWFKAAGVVLQPASDGTGVIAGGAVRSVLELAGVQNVLAKRLGSRSCLNNARVTIKALESLRTMDDYAAARGLPLDYMLS